AANGAEPFFLLTDRVAKSMVRPFQIPCSKARIACASKRLAHVLADRSLPARLPRRGPDRARIVHETLPEPDDFARPRPDRSRPAGTSFWRRIHQRNDLEKRRRTDHGLG